MDDWEKSKETTSPDKKVFCTCLNIEDIREADYKHGKRVCTDFEIKTWGNIVIFILGVMHYF